MLKPSVAERLWEDLHLHAHTGIDTLELCLTHRGKPVGFALARDLHHQGLRWLEPPSGLDWAEPLLNEAAQEWLRQRRVAPATPPTERAPPDP